MESQVSHASRRKAAVSAVFLSTLCLTIGAAPASAGILYDNGTYNRVLGGPGINQGTSTADSFVLSGAAVVTGVTFYAWEHSSSNYNGDPITSVGWAITSGPFSGSTYASGTAAPTDAFVTFPYGPPGYDNLRSETISIPSLGLSAGTYWLQLLNATASGEVLTWDDVTSVSSQGYVMLSGGSTRPESSGPFQVLGDTTGAPEPGSLGMLATGVLGMAALLRRRVGR